MVEQTPNDLYEDKFARTYAEIRRLDQLFQSYAESQARLSVERDRRLDEQLTSQKEAVAVALSQAEKAAERAQKAQDKVNTTQNEFRGSLNDYVKDLVTRRENEQVIAEMRGLIAQNQAAVTDLRSRIDVGPPSLSTLQSRSDESLGRRYGALDTRTVVFAVLGAAGAIIGIVATIIAIVGR